METAICEKLKEILSKHNLTVEDSIRLFLSETVKQGKIPFDYTEADVEEARKNPLVTVVIHEDE